MDGFSFLVLAMGTFAMTEAVYMASKVGNPARAGPSFRLRSLARPHDHQHHSTAVGRGSPGFLYWDVARGRGNHGIPF